LHVKYLVQANLIPINFDRYFKIKN
jgi:hypothetical protein